MKYIGCVAYRNFKYTKMAINSILETTTPPFRIVLVIGDPDDSETEKFASKEKSIEVIHHDTNRGFPAGLNDISDYVYSQDPDADILFVGNDTLAYPGTVDAMFDLTDGDCYTAVEVNISNFLRRFPQHRWMFGNNYRLEVEGFDAYLDYELSGTWETREINFINGFHNYTLVRRSFFDKVGYVDENFYPAYFEDNDYVHRGFKAGCEFREINYPYFHFWSRTVHEAQSGKVNSRYFPLNRDYYEMKWGGVPTREFYEHPFAGMPYPLHDSVVDNRYFDGFMRDNAINFYMMNYWKWTPKMFKNRHIGQKCIIAANGPSLNDIDMNLLGDQIVIGLNRGYLKEDLPITYLVACNGSVLKQFGDEIINVPTEATFITPYDNLWKPHVYGMTYTPEEIYNENFDSPIYQGHTVTYVALQLAYYMGFTSVAIVGLDHYFPRAEGKKDNDVVISDSDDTDHFSPDYFGVGVEWAYPNLGKSEEAYQLAKEAYENDGRMIYNCSTVTKCDVFDRISIEEFISL